MTVRDLRRGALAAVLAVLAASAGLRAQHARPPAPAAYALEGVTVVRPDGTRQDGMTLVVRGELIEALGPDAAVPADARVLEGDSLRVYPGLVDAEGEPRFEFPDPEGEDDEAPVAWAPERGEQGLLAHRRAADHLQAEGSDLSGARKAGVVASAVLPDDAALPGSGAALLHRVGSAAPASLVLRPELGPVMAFEPAGRAYPSTHFGVVAFLRQTLEDAGRHARLAEAHASSPRGMAAPRWDPVLATLSGAVDGDGRVFFRAHRASDIRQALELAERHGFRIAVVGGREAWRVADLLARRQVPVLVSTDFPEPRRWDPDAGGGEQQEEGAAPPDSAAGGGGPEPAEAGAGGAAQEELEPEVAREKRRIEDAWANAGRLVDAGVTVALTSGGGEADLREGARTAVENGLAEAEALRAVTSVPARLLGVPWLARIEAGMPATFVVTDGPLLEEDSRVAYTFVEGRLEEGAVPGEGPEEPPAVDVSGSWEMEVDGAMGTLEATLTLEQTDGRLQGEMETQFGTLEVTGGTVSGREISFTAVLDAGGQTAELSFSGTVEGDEMSGSGSGPPQMGSFSWEASRSTPGAEDDR